MALLEVNHRLRSEVKAAFMSRLSANFCMNSDDWRNYAMKCFGKEYYAYRDLTRRNQRLSNALRNLRAVNFSIIARQVVLTTAEARMNPVELVTDFPKWHLMDNAQLMVNALNASPSVRRVNICCTFQDKGFGPHSRY